MDQNKIISIRCEAQEYHDIEDLIPFQGKLKSISSDNFHKLKESIKSDGIPLGFHIWKQKDKTYIMDGHHRKMALQALKDEGYFIPPVPCNLVIAKSKKEAAKIVLISNSKYSRVSEESLSDYMIDMELKVEDLENLDIPELNMDDFEPEQESKDGLTDDDAVPEVDQNIHGVSLGDIYQLGNHRLMCGDSTSIDAVGKLMDGQKADMVFTDPPYGYKYESNHQAKHKMLENDDKILDFMPMASASMAENSTIYVFGSHQTIDKWKQIFCDNFKYKNMIVWQKNNWSMGSLKDSFAGQHELILFGTKGKVEIIGKRDSDIWKFDREPPKEHPTMKPVELIEFGMSKFQSGKVLDLFGGSGSTLIACEKTNRKCFMMELDPHYCSVIIERWQQFTGQKAVKLDAKMMR